MICLLGIKMVIHYLVEMHLAAIGTEHSEGKLFHIKALSARWQVTNLAQQITPDGFDVITKELGVEIIIEIIQWG